MIFKISVWRKFYDEIKYLSQILKDSSHTFTEGGVRIAPVNKISREAKKIIERDIEILLDKVSKYLDAAGFDYLGAERRGK